MGTQRAIDEVDIRRRIEAGVAAVRGGSSHGPRGCDGALRSGYRVVRHRIAASVRRSRGEAESLGGSLRDVPAPARIRGSRLTIAVGDDVAFGHSVNRISGVLKNGTRPISGFGGRRASARSRATGSSSTIRFRCRWIRRPAQRCWISGRDNWSGGTEANSDRGLADQDRRTPASDDARSISGIPTHRRLDRRVLT
jgi:hypothetical protein